jgi:hypothetical protein
VQVEAVADVGKYFEAELKLRWPSAPLRVDDAPRGDEIVLAQLDQDWHGECFEPDVLGVAPCVEGVEPEPPRHRAAKLRIVVQDDRGIC